MRDLEKYRIFVPELRRSLHIAKYRNEQKVARFHLYQHLLIGMTPADTGTGYIMCLWCQTLRHKHFVTGFYHSGIIHHQLLFYASFDSRKNHYIGARSQSVLLLYF